MVVDLHVHSTASSDADFTPREIVEMAINKKLWAIAITAMIQWQVKRKVCIGGINLAWK